MEITRGQCRETKEEVGVCVGLQRYARRSKKSWKLFDCLCVFRQASMNLNVFLYVLIGYI